MPDGLIRVGFLDASAASAVVGAPVVLDLAEFAHEDEVAEALGGSEWSKDLLPLVPAVLVEPYVAALQDRQPPVVILNRVESAAHVEQAAAILGAHRPTIVARLATGAALYHLDEIAHAVATSGGMSPPAIWYAPVDLDVDFNDEPAHPYFMDGHEGRLAASGWVRSRCLTVTRSFGLELWGQADLMRAEPLSTSRLRDIEHLARLAGFDRLIVRERS